MATIDAPDFPIRRITWSLDCPAQVVRSGWTGTQTVIATPWLARWRARVELAPIQGEAGARTFKAFIARCRGSTQAFRLPATEGAQNANNGVTVATAAEAGDTTLVISGAATDLKDGQLATVNGQLLCLTADQAGSDISFQPPLRDAASVGTTVVTSRPYALVYMASASNGWRVSPGRLFGIAFDVEEAVLEAESAVTPEGVTFDSSAITFDETSVTWDNA